MCSEILLLAEPVRSLRVWILEGIYRDQVKMRIRVVCLLVHMMLRYNTRVGACVGWKEEASDNVGMIFVCKVFPLRSGLQNQGFRPWLHIPDTAPKTHHTVADKGFMASYVACPSAQRLHEITVQRA